MAVQKFLNDKRILDAKLIVDGRTGPNSKTEAAIMKFQEMAKIYPADGVWGPETESQLKEKRPEWYKIWKSYKPGLFW
jgi:peptidoglycan hydrolase-like protein with peptidoglycan-binding domain